MVDLVKDMQSTGQIANVDTGFIQPNVKKEFSSAPIVNKLTGDLMDIASDSYKSYLTQGLGERLENIASTAQMEMGNAESFEEAASITDLTKKFKRLKNVAEQKGGMDRVRIQAEAEIKKALTRHPGMAQAYGQVAGQVLGFNPTGSALAIAEQEYSLNAAKAKSQLDYYAADAAKYGMTLEEINSNPKMADEYATLRQGAKTLAALRQKKEIEGFLGANGPSKEESDRQTRDIFHKNRGEIRAYNLVRAEKAVNSLYKDALAQKGYKLGEKEPVSSALIEEFLTEKDLKILEARFIQLRDAAKQSDGIYDYRSAFDGKDDQFNRYTEEVYDNTWAVFSHAFNGAAAVDMVLNYSNKINADNMGVMAREDTMKMFQVFNNFGVEANMFKNSEEFATLVLKARTSISEGRSLQYTNLPLETVTRDTVHDLELVLKSWEGSKDGSLSSDVRTVFGVAASIIANPERVDPKASLEMVRAINAMSKDSLEELYEGISQEKDGQKAFSKGMVKHTTRLASDMSRVFRDNNKDLTGVTFELDDRGHLSVNLGDGLAFAKKLYPTLTEAEALAMNRDFIKSTQASIQRSPQYKMLVKFTKEYNETVESINRLGFGGLKESTTILEHNNLLGTTAGRLK